MSTGTALCLVGFLSAIIVYNLDKYGMRQREDEAILRNQSENMVSLIFSIPNNDQRLKLLVGH